MALAFMALAFMALCLYVEDISLGQQRIQVWHQIMP
jgi:hypothetical protein